MLFIILNMSFSITFMTLNHPLSLGLVLLIQTTLISLISGNLCMNFWFSYILFLIMIGGMLILFIYMTSIASNDKFKINTKFNLMTIMILVGSIVPCNLNFPADNSIKNNLTATTSNLKELLTFSMTKFTTPPLSLLLMFMIIYLFLALIAIVKIINTNQGPLRPKT
uniref:NADH dehydrogenase subunit 6 n=1 Tax=Croscherichia paykulli TaxID=268442 RepID=UPI001FA77B0E|nr:NADH dehydrogenase subunit 6 [Croscherichia paykulli]UMR54844.1 NADH dehydrogenase subunit 6 [Croscherichia paykulli]